MASLANSPVGTTVPISGFDARIGADYAIDAYIPHDLPNELKLPDSTWLVITEARAALARLDAMADLIPNPRLITRVVTRREAIGTSALEGTFAALPEVMAAEVLEASNQRENIAPDVAEVLNYTRAAAYAFDWIDERPITWGLISSLQALMVEGTSSDGPKAGEIRDSQVFIGTKNRPIHKARFVPPPPGDALRAMCDRWLSWLLADEPRQTIPLLARVAMAHYQFETLHPFTDGNGRVGRLVMVLQLMAERELSQPILSVSVWLTERASEYRDHLLRVSQSGEWAPWIEFLATAVRDEAHAGYQRIKRLLVLKEELAQSVRANLPRGRLAIDIADDLIANPVLNVADVVTRYRRSDQASRNAIAQLVKLNVLEPYGDDRYDRLFWNRRVFQVINS